MEYKFKYENKEERDSIIKEHSNLILIEEQNITEGNFLIFTDIQPEQSEEIQDLNTRINDITEYLSSSDETTITNIEQSILTIEQNKINNGGM